MDFPKMVYRAPGSVLLHGVMVDHIIVDSRQDFDVAIADGWCLTPTKAGEASQVKEGRPTRTELETKAAELGIKFDGRTSDKKLNEQIDARLKD